MQKLGRITFAACILLSSPLSAFSADAEERVQSSTDSSKQDPQALPPKSKKGKAAKKKKGKPKKAAPPPAPPPPEFEEVNGEKWTKHFSIFEITPEGRKIRVLGGSVVDKHSIVVIERTSETPEFIEAYEGDKNFTQDAEKYKEGFRAKVIRHYFVENNSERRCQMVIAAHGLDKVGDVRSTGSNIGGCPGTPTSFVLPNKIKKGDQFRIELGDTNVDDEIEVQMSGKTIGTTNAKEKDCTEKICKTSKVPLPGLSDAIKFRVADFYSTAPWEKRPQKVSRRMSASSAQITPRQGQWESLVAEGDRFDPRRGLVFDSDPRLTTRKFNEHIAVKATIQRNGERLDEVTCNSDGPRPKCSGIFRDGDTVTFRIVRKHKVEGKEIEETIRTYSLEASTPGLHWAPFGDHRAYYSSATAVAVAFPDNSSELTFAQTAAYSVYVKSQERIWLEAISVGAHFAVLGDLDDESSEEDNQDSKAGEKSPVSFGIGGQLGLGKDAFQLGAGYDFISDHPYLFVGISVPDAIKGIQKLSRIRRTNISAQ